MVQQECPLFAPGCFPAMFLLAACLRRRLNLLNRLTWLCAPAYSQGRSIAVGIFHLTGEAQCVLPPGNGRDGIGSARTAQGLRQRWSKDDGIWVCRGQAEQMAHQQMDAERAPAIALNTRVSVVGLTPFAALERAPVFARHAGKTTVFIQFAAIC